MHIQWFPGHMQKARRQIEEKLKLIDVILELVDARIPMSSRNPLLTEIIGNKPRLIIMTKIDMADPRVTKEWVEYFHAQGIEVVLVDAIKKTGFDKISKKCRELLTEKIERDKKRGLKPRPIRALVVGIPNVGKSTVINRLRNKKVAQTGDRPGVTKAQQWIKIGKELELLDTPGILWPKFEDQRIGMNLAITGAIKDSILPKDDIAIHALKYLDENYKSKLIARYDLGEYNIDDVVSIYDQIGKKRGCIMRGNEIDYEKVTDVILRDVLENYFGPVSFETVSDYEVVEEDV